MLLLLQKASLSVNHFQYLRAAIFHLWLFSSELDAFFVPFLSSRDSCAIWLHFVFTTFFPVKHSTLMPNFTDWVEWMTIDTRLFQCLRSILFFWRERSQSTQFTCHGFGLKVRSHVMVGEWVRDSVGERIWDRLEVGLWKVSFQWKISSRSIFVGFLTTWRRLKTLSVSGSQIYYCASFAQSNIKLGTLLSPLTSYGSILLQILSRSGSEQINDPREYPSWNRAGDQIFLTCRYFFPECHAIHLLRKVIFMHIQFQ
jgi:hypothetical protein